MSNAFVDWMKESKVALEGLDKIKLNCSNAVLGGAFSNSSMILETDLDNQLKLLEDFFERGRNMRSILPELVYHKAVSSDIESHLSGRKVHYSTERHCYDLRMGLLKRIVEQECVVLLVSAETNNEDDREFFEWVAKQLNTKYESGYDPDGDNPWFVAKDNSDRMCVVYRRNRD